MSFGLEVPVWQAQEAIKSIANVVPSQGWVALVHGTSRADKAWPLAHWRSLIERLNAKGYGVLLPHGNAAEAQASRAMAQGFELAQVLPGLPLDTLTDTLAGCAGVIGVDSGLSHIAVALDLPHVQIYNFDTAWRTGPLAEQQADRTGPTVRQRSVFASPYPSVDEVWQAWRGVLGPTNPGEGQVSTSEPSGCVHMRHPE